MNLNVLFHQRVPNRCFLLLAILHIGKIACKYFVHAVPDFTETVFIDHAPQIDRTVIEKRQTNYHLHVFHGNADEIQQRILHHIRHLYRKPLRLIVLVNHFIQHRLYRREVIDGEGTQHPGIPGFNSINLTFRMTGANFVVCNQQTCPFRQAEIVAQLMDLVIADSDFFRCRQQSAQPALYRLLRLVAEPAY